MKLNGWVEFTVLSLVLFSRLATVFLVPRDGWLTSGENRGFGEHFVEMEANLIELGDHKDQPSQNMENEQSKEVNQPVNSVQTTLKIKRSTVKRKIAIFF